MRSRGEDLVTIAISSENHGLLSAYCRLQGVGISSTVDDLVETFLHRKMSRNNKLADTVRYIARHTTTVKRKRGTE